MRPSTRTPSNGNDPPSNEHSEVKAPPEMTSGATPCSPILSSPLTKLYFLNASALVSAHLTGTAAICTVPFCAIPLEELKTTFENVVNAAVDLYLHTSSDPPFVSPSHQGNRVGRGPATTIASENTPPSWPLAIRRLIDCHNDKLSLCAVDIHHRP